MYYTVYDGEEVISEGEDRKLVVTAALILRPDSERLIGVRVDEKGREAAFHVRTNANLTTAMWG